MNLASSAVTAAALLHGKPSAVKLVALAYTAARNAVESDGRADRATLDALHLGTHELSRLLDLEPARVAGLMSAIDAEIATPLGK